jgi:heptosyltransferase I
VIAGTNAFSQLEGILIVRLGSMGDVIHTLPAVQALRAALPDSAIGWLIEERWAELLCAPGQPRRGTRSPQRPLVDWIHTVDLRGWRKSLFTLSTTQEIARVWNDVRSAHYDVAIDLQGAIRSAILARWSGARTVWGTAQPWEAPASLWYTRRVIASGRHVVEQNLSVVKTIVQAPLNATAVQFPRDQEAENRVGQILRQASVHEFAILNPGAGWGAKRWPAERYGLVAKSLACEGLRSIINYGPGEENLAGQAEAASAGAGMAVKSSITDLIALMRRAKLFIGGDTGPLHLAAALHVPVVAIFGPTDPERNGPYGTRREVLRNPTSRTSHARLAHPEQGLLDITADSVISAARQMLHGEATETHHG